MMARELMFGRKIIYFKAMQNFSSGKTGNILLDMHVQGKNSFTQQNIFLAIGPQIPREELH